MTGNKSKIKRLSVSQRLSEPNLSKKIKIDNTENEILPSSSLHNIDESKVNESEVDIVESHKNNSCSEIEETLICSICQDIMHDCVSILPCLHSFCAICLLNWKKSGSGCPTCRGNIVKVSRNHLVKSIVDKFLAQNPDKGPSAEEIKEADSEVEKYKAVLFSNDPITIERTNCRFCNYPGIPVYSETSPSNTPCNDNIGHAQCHCCQLHIPIIPGNTSVPANKCQMCNRFSCSLLFGDCSGCDSGCLFTFKDYVFNSNLNNISHVPQFIPDNFYETNVLRNYLNNQNMTVSNMYSQCLGKLANKEIHLPNGVDDVSSLCGSCSKKAVLDMVYEYFVLIPKSSFPVDVRSRPDCYYGKNCRTQRHRERHCATYNHACPQTRF